MSRRLASRIFALAIATCAAWPDTVSAAVLITRGDTVKHIADIPSPAKELVVAMLQRDGNGNRNVQPAVGFAYKYWGIFWIDFWTWDGRFCIYEDRTVYGEPPVAFLAGLLNVSEAELTPPFFYRFPPGLLIIAGFILLGVLCAVFKKSPIQRQKALVEDVRYQRAVEIIAEELQKEENAAKTHAANPDAPATAETIPSLTPFDTAVEYLVREGIPRDEAQANLALILSTNVPASQSGEPT